MHKFIDYKHLSNTTLRIIFGIIIGVILLFMIFSNKLIYCFCVVAMSCLMFYEWKSFSQEIVDIMIGLCIISIMMISLIYIKLNFEDKTVFWYFATISSVDIFAMISGKLIGGPRLAPRISPNKTWAGLICGVSLAYCMMHVFDSVFHFSHFFYCFDNERYGMFLSTLLLGFIGQMSDLFESFFKRKYNVKDSGDLIPGHGGVLDRFDGLLLTAPISALLLQ